MACLYKYSLMPDENIPEQHIDRVSIIFILFFLCLDTKKQKSRLPKNLAKILLNPPLQKEEIKQSPSFLKWDLGRF